MAGEWVKDSPYPQAPAMVEEELEAFFEQALFARLGTTNEDGTIHIAPVYFKYEDGQILIPARIFMEQASLILEPEEVDGT